MIGLSKVETQWYKYDRYKIRDGYIQPVAGSKLKRYDLWKKLKNQYEKTTSNVHPSTLLDRIIKAHNDNDHDAADRQIKKFVDRFGMLGCLLSNVTEVRFPYYSRAVKVSNRAGSGYLTDEELSELLSPTKNYHWETEATQIRLKFNPSSNSWDKDVLATDGWDEEHWDEALGKYTFIDTPDEILSLSKEKTGTVMHETFWSEHGVALYCKEQSSNAKKDIRTWFDYFPEIKHQNPCAYDWPAPYTQEFWEIYREPRTAFIEGAKTLLNMSNQFIELSDRRYQQELGPKFLVKIDVQSLNQRFKNLTFGLHAQISINQDMKLLFSWSCPSLLAGLLILNMIDLTSPRGLRPCKSCETPFRPDRNDQIYCSDPCRKRYKARERRKDPKERKKEAAKARERYHKEKEEEQRS